MEIALLSGFSSSRILLFSYFILFPFFYNFFLLILLYSILWFRLWHLHTIGIYLIFFLYIQLFCYFIIFFSMDLIEFYLHLLFNISILSIEGLNSCVWRVWCVMCVIGWYMYVCVQFIRVDYSVIPSRTYNVILHLTPKKLFSRRFWNFSIMFIFGILKAQ